jgi:hypothetical protein
VRGLEAAERQFEIEIIELIARTTHPPPSCVALSRSSLMKCKIEMKDVT